MSSVPKWLKIGLVGCAISAVIVVIMFASGIRRKSIQQDSERKDIRGTPIHQVGPARSSRSISNLAPNPAISPPDAMDGGFIRLAFDKLSDFKYDLYEVYDEVNGGRPLTRSDDVIPPRVKAYNGKRVAVTGFVLALRLKKGLVTEFLLLRDQGSCCFGKEAKMNHYIRVKLKTGGFAPGSVVPHTAYGLLKVGEIYVQGYLTGIYEMDAEKVVPQE